MFLPFLPLVLAAQDPGVAFAPRNDFLLGGSQPQDLAVADVDRDGDLDLVVPSAADPEPTVKLNDGHGDFQAEETLASAFPSWGVGQGDFNGDGWTDFVFGDGWTDGSAVEIWYGDPADPTRPKLGVTLQAGRFPIDFAAGDLDGDGDEDLVVTNNVLYGLTVFENLGGGSFAPPRHVSSAASLKGRRLVLADVDEDGDLDAVLTAYGLWFFLNDGAGHFPVWVAAGSGHPALAVADLDEDGHLDFATAELYSSRVNVAFGDGAGGISRTAFLDTASDVTALDAADWNGDGIADLAVVHSYLDQVALYTGLGDGTFVGPADFVTAKHPQVAGHGDLDGDGRPDLAVPCHLPGAQAPVSILLDTTPPQAWVHLGLGLAGPAGLPLLRGSGDPFPGATVFVELRHGPPSGQAALVAGTGRLDRPFHGGILVPTPDRVRHGIPLDSTGAFRLPLVVPAGLPPGFRAWLQAWSEAGDAASNALQLTVR